MSFPYLDPMTLTLKLALDIVKVFLHTSSCDSKVTAQTATQTDLTKLLPIHIHG